MEDASVAGVVVLDVEAPCPRRQPAVQGGQCGDRPEGTGQRTRSVEDGEGGLVIEHGRRPGAVRRTAAEIVIALVAADPERNDHPGGRREVELDVSLVGMGHPDACIDVRDRGPAWERRRRNRYDAERGAIAGRRVSRTVVDGQVRVHACVRAPDPERTELLLLAELGGGLPLLLLLL